MQRNKQNRNRKIAQNRPEGARYLAQGKRYSAPPWGQSIPIKQAAPTGQDKIIVQYLALTGRLKIIVAH